MDTMRGSVLERPATKSMCRHHWMIEPPDGPLSKGVCKLCGEVRMFNNILEDLFARSDSATPRSLASLVGVDEVEDEEDFEAS